MAPCQDPVLLVRDSFKRYLEAALLHLSDLQRRWPSESTSQRWQVEELTHLCKECGLASAKAVVACERVLKSRWNAQVQEAEELARGVPMPGFAKQNAPRVPKLSVEKRVKSTQKSPHQRWRALKKGLKPLAIQDVARSPAALPQPSLDEQMERRRLHAALRLQRAGRGYVQRLRRRQRQAAAEVLATRLSCRVMHRLQLGLKHWRHCAARRHRAALTICRAAQGWLTWRCQQRAVKLSAALNAAQRRREERRLQCYFHQWLQRLHSRRNWELRSRRNCEGEIGRAHV